MSFYESLYPFYDKIFPLNQQAATFLLSHFHKGASILDVGAGTGNMAIALAKEGLKVKAIEPEQAMANDILSKADAEGISMEVQTKTMEQIGQLDETYDGIYCVGNTLPHLQSMTEIQRFLEQCFAKLNKGGTLIIQTVNFDKFLASDNFSFPVIEKENFKFERKYESLGGKVQFTAILTTHGKSSTNTIPLFPVTAKVLVPLLEKAGFKENNVFGNFKGEAHSVKSPALVVVAEV